MQGETVRSPISIAPGRCDHQSPRAVHRAPGRCGHQSHKKTQHLQRESDSCPNSEGLAKAPGRREHQSHKAKTQNKGVDTSRFAKPKVYTSQFKRQNPPKILITVAQIASVLISFIGVSRALGMMALFGDAPTEQVCTPETILRSANRNESALTESHQAKVTKNLQHDDACRKQ